MVRVTTPEGKPSEPQPNAPDLSAWADGAERRRIAEDLERSFLVEAAAGTGKTEALVTRLVALICAGHARVEGIAALTFAEKAAGEMRHRLHTKLEQARAAVEPGARRERIEAALRGLDAAHINTFHGFCAELLREFPLEAAVDPAFELMPDDGEALYDEAFDAFWQSTLADPPVGVRRLLRQRSWRWNEGPRQQLYRAGRQLVGHRDFATPWRSALTATASSSTGLDANPTEAGPSKAAAAARAALEEMEPLVDRVAELGRYASEGKTNDPLREGMEKAHELTRRIRHRRDAAGEDPAALREHSEWLDAQLRQLATQYDGPLRCWSWSSPRMGRIAREDVLAHRETVKSAIDEWMERTGPTLAAQLQQALGEVVQRYCALMRERGKLDYLELLLRTRALLREDTYARQILRERFTHIFVDEVQDADVVQLEIAWSLACRPEADVDWKRSSPPPGALFLVGDPKQSIYRFRRADLGLYGFLADRFTGGEVGEVLTLRRSFRAVPGLHAFVNAAFGKAMVAEPGVQPRHIDLESHRARSGDQPSVVALPIPEPYGTRGIAKTAMKASTPRAIAAFVSFLVRESGWSVEQPSGKRRPIRAGDICLLFRQTRDWSDDLFDSYGRALETERIPHVVVGRGASIEREELVALRQALGAIEWPDDALRVYATLRGPFFGIPDEDLFLFQARHGRIHPLDTYEAEPETDAQSEVREALGLLARLHVGRNERPLADTAMELLEATRAHAGVVLWNAGVNALAHLRALVGRIRVLDGQGITSFRSLVEQLERDAESGRELETLPVEEGLQGVRMMSVHKAKGLEFPVVILAHPVGSSGGRPSRYIDMDTHVWAEPLCGAVPAELVEHAEVISRADAAEELRVLYVACTRARELLVVPAVGDGPPEEGQPDHGWLAPLHPVLYPPKRDRHRVDDAPGCPAMSDEPTVMNRPYDVVTDDPVRAGRQRSGIVWWSGERLKRPPAPSSGARRGLRALLDPSGAEAQSAIDAHHAWEARLSAARSAGQQPTVVGRTITSLGSSGSAQGRPGSAMPPVVMVSTEAVHELSRPRGSRFGTLVHQLMAEVPLDREPTSDAAIRALAEVHSRLLGATDVELEAAVRAVHAALRHPLLRRAAAASHVRREVPVFYRLPDGVIAEGVIDLAFAAAASEADLSAPAEAVDELDAMADSNKTGASASDVSEATTARWTVVDYKTDLVQTELSADKSTAYRAQIALYAEAIAAATGASSVDGFLMGI